MLEKLNAAWAARRALLVGGHDRMTLFTEALLSALGARPARIPTSSGAETLNRALTAGRISALIVPSLFGTASNVFMMRQYMLKIPDDFRDSGFIDGCGHFRIWLQIILPMCVPTLVSLGVLTFMGHWNNYLGPMIYLSSREKMTVPIVLRMFQNSYTTRWNLLMAAACIALAPVIVLYIACQKFIISGIMLGGIKG